MSSPITMRRVEEFLAERRRLGFQAHKSGYALISFARYMDGLDHRGPLTVEHMTEWARHDKWQRGVPETWARRLKLLRPFTRWLRQFEPRTEVPDESVFGPVPGRVAPHIYRENEIVELLAAARQLNPQGSLRPKTFETLFGLIAAAGLRVSEALALFDADVDLSAGTLTVRQSKFAKSRQLPLHPSTIEALAGYRRLRSRKVRTTNETPFFVGTRGKRLGQPLSERQVHRVFIELRDRLGWINRGAHAGPRIHDLRHSFAVRRVMLWHEHGIDIDQAMLALSTYLGHAKISNTYWYLTGVPELMALAGNKFERFAPSFGALVQAFFAEHLTQQRALSPRTVAAYRDAFMLFLGFAQARLTKSPVAMRMIDITPELILAFLDHLERERHNTVRSRNARLAGLRAFLKFAAHRDMASLHIIERCLGVPMKRFERPMLGFLSREEMLAVLGTPGSSWIGQRDHLLLGLLYNTGARVSEIIAVHVADVVLDGAACVHLHGKGRKQRSVPLWRSTVTAVRAWVKQNPQFGPASALLPNRNGAAMTRDNVIKRLALAVRTAAKVDATLAKRRVSPHTIRHTTAMHLLQSGVDISVIALWLGHESPTTTHHYVEADLAMKDRALARLQEPDTKMRRYRAPDSLLEFLKTL